MKYLSLAFVLMSFHFASANPVAIGNYKGHAEGAIRLNAEDGTAVLGNSNVEVQVERINPLMILKYPVQFFKKSRLLTLKNETMDTFQFLIPGKIQLVDGEALITAEQSSQTADLKIRETRKFIESKEEPFTDTCTMSGTCHTCGQDASGNMACGPAYSNNCPGKEKILSRLDTYERALELTVTDGTQSVQVKTESTPEYRRTKLKTLEECH